MKKIDLGQTINTLANIGVIAGIMFLAIEVRQNQATLEEGNAMNLASLQIAAQDSFGNFRSLILENEGLFQVWQDGLNGRDLTEIEIEKFNTLCMEQIMRLSRTYTIFRLLNQELEAANAGAPIRANREASVRYRDCWENTVPLLLNRGMQDFVSTVVSLEGQD